MNLIESTILNELKANTYEFYANMDIAHSHEHCERVAMLASYIAAKEGGEVFLCVSGGYLHQYHDHLEELEKILMQTEMMENRKEKIYEIVKCCRPGRINNTQLLEAKIVFDADALELITTYGAVREIVCNIAVRKFSWKDSVSKTQSVQSLFYENIQTATGRAIGESSWNTCKRFWADYEDWRTLCYL